MKKKLLLLFIALIVVSLLVFSACNDPANDDGGDGDQIENNGGTENGGAESGDGDEDAIVYDCSAGKHNYTVENKCVLCGAKLKYSEGLKFELSYDETYYAIMGIGTCTDTELVIPYGYNGKPVTNIGLYAFEDCTGLTSVTIPNSVTIIGSSAFYGCFGLKSVTIGNSVTSIRPYTFYGCTRLTSITIPNSVKGIGTYAFGNCTGLTSITIGNGVTGICYEAFVNTGYSNNKANWENGVLYVGKYLLKAENTISGSYNVKVGTLCIGDSAFSGCTGLTSVTIPNSVTSIDDSAFIGCDGLTSVTIGNGVTSIGDNAFNDCDGLTSIKYRGTQSLWNKIRKGYNWDYRTFNYTITYNYTGE